MEKSGTTKSSWTPTNPAFDPKQPMQIGGQAVIEGVMMRAPGSVATALRRRDGSIIVKKEPFVSIVEKVKLLKLPVLRGAVGLIDMLYLGIKTLNFSAEIAGQDLEPVQSDKSNGSDQPAATTRGGQSRGMLVLSVVIAVVVALGIFFVTPLVVTTYLFRLEQTALAFNLVAGAIRIVLFLLYLAGISLLPDIRRLFQYHGAEHKSVFAFELNDELVVGAARTHTRYHPRCGTSFLLIVMVVAILSFSLIDAALMSTIGHLSLLLRLAVHLPFVPVIGGLAYEVIRFSARHTTTWWGRILVAPGLWLQTVTTREPDDQQLEVALVALRCALGLEDPARFPITPLTTGAASPAGRVAAGVS